MYKSSLAFRVGVEDIVIGEVYTPLDLDSNGEYTLRGTQYYPPYKVESVDEDRQVVIVRHGVISPDTEELSFDEFGLTEGGSRCLLPTTAALPILDALRGPRPTRNGYTTVASGLDKHDPMPGTNLLMAPA